MPGEGHRGLLQKRVHETSTSLIERMHTMRRQRLFRAIGVAFVLAGVAMPGEGTCGNGSFWPDTFVSRLEALALLQTLNAELLSHDSATLVLDRWCRTHRLAAPARIVAERVNDRDRTPTAEQRQLLQLSDTEAVRYRNVRLRCGSHILSEADNWYVPGRLSEDMNRRLDTTDEAFGRVVQPLHFQRRTLSARLLWWPLPDGWEMGATESEDTSSNLSIPAMVLEHRAVLTLPNGTPVSEVVETYTAAILAFGPPSSR
jgi:chorismate-pyruvate lyase